MVRSILALILLTLVGCGGASNGADGGADAAGDTGVDAGTDAGLPPECPTADAYVGDPSWPHSLLVTQGGRYCSTFRESRTLKEELAAKGVSAIAPGSYPLPDEEGTFPFLLPVCLERPKGDFVSVATTGTLTHDIQIFESNEFHRFEIRQPVALSSGTRELFVELRFQTGIGEQGGMTLDGTAPDPFDFESTATIVLCAPEEQCFGGDALVFDSCAHEEAGLYNHAVTLGEDNVDFELRIGQSAAGTEPGAFIRAHGSYRDVAFDQQDYWSLIYNPLHHHFARSFAVLFDELIDGACGIQVVNLEPFGDDFAEDVAHTVDCELNELQELDITDVQITTPP